MPGPRVKGWMVIYSLTFACLALFFYTAKLTDRGTCKALWQKDSEKKLRAFFAGIAGFLVAYPLVIAVGQSIHLVMSVAFSIKPTDQVVISVLKLSMHYPVMSTFMVIGVVCLVPIAEELLFRGYLQGWMRRYLNPGGAIVMTSMIFAGFHFSIRQGWSNVELLTSLFILSLFLGVLYEKNRTLWAPIGLHMIFNAFNVSLVYWSA